MSATAEVIESGPRIDEVQHEHPIIGDSISPDLSVDIVWNSIEKIAIMGRGRSGRKDAMVPVTLASGESTELETSEVKALENTEIDGLVLAHYIRIDKKAAIMGTAFISVLAAGGIVAALQKRPALDIK